MSRKIKNMATLPPETVETKGTNPETVKKVNEAVRLQKKIADAKRTFEKSIRKDKLRLEELTKDFRTICAASDTSMLEGTEGYVNVGDLNTRILNIKKFLNYVRGKGIALSKVLEYLTLTLKAAGALVPEAELEEAGIIETTTEKYKGKVTIK